MCMGLRDPATVYDLRDGLAKDQGVTAVPPLMEPPGGSQSTATEHRQSPLRFALTEYFPKFRELRATNSEYLNRCARCFLKGLCEQCPAKSWMEHGTLDTPVEYLCAVAHAQARYLSLLKETEKAWEIEDWRQRIGRFAQVHGSGVRET
jgi:radical SAM protein with 4Fe4S-binding SPASM domain